eukprot:UN28411
MFGFEKYSVVWDTWLTSTEKIDEYLVTKVEAQERPMYYTKKLNRNKSDYKMDHLECFYPGSLALSSTIENNPHKIKQFNTC